MFYSHLKLNFLAHFLLLGMFLIFCTLHPSASKQCQHQDVTIYHDDPGDIRVDWSVESDLCFSYQECYGISGDINFLPQLCPIEIQPGDRLFLLPPTPNDFQAIYAANVSEENFVSCSFQNISTDQRLTPSAVSVPLQVPAKFLPAGQVAYFIQLPSSIFATCEFGLRLRVLVKTVDCERNLRSGLCSGRGECVSGWLEEQYYCECAQNYTGPYCEEFNGCSFQPCSNGGTCVDLTLGDISEEFLCICPEHLTGPTCQVIEGSCIANHKCVNGNCRNASSNSHVCVCNSGFSGVFCDENINECLSNPCLSGATCRDNISGYDCICPEHYIGTRCEEVKNHCDQMPCLNDGICSSFFGGYNCTCSAGFSGRNCSMNIDDCASVPCQNNGTCQDLVNMFRCICSPGYTGSLCTTDTDECLSSPCRESSTCKDHVNGFTCECLPGWTGPLCDVDISECDSNPCLNNGQCMDENNGYTCICPPGLFGGLVCEVPLHNCSFQPCLHNGTCNVVDDVTYSCDCTERYTGENCQVFIPFCAENNCSDDSVCVEEESGYGCNCSGGFEGEFCQVNIDDCRNNSCKNGATCMDRVDGFTCHCPSGFLGVNCDVNFNECSSRPCTNGGSCLDVVDGFLCLCLAGFEGIACEVDVEECASSPCLNGGSCTDEVNGYSCDCGIGFNGTDCSFDLDLCSMGVCSNYSISCTETESGHNYSCACGPGFTGHNCEIDINECSSSPCRNDAICRDSINAYQCYCLPGYVGDNCEFEINECFSSPCLHNSTCVDLFNNYTCVCQEGYEGQNCEIDIDDCLSHRCHHNATCVDEVNGYSCECLKAYTGILCEEELDECSSNPCNANTSMCVDLFDGYQCYCLNGWAGPTCMMNIDECLSQPCLNGATCRDGISEYSCHCADGFQGSNCEIEINECGSEPCLHSATCIDTLAGYDCVCLEGFEGANCEININECASHPCNHNGTCIDLINGFTCECLPTYYGVDCSLLPCQVSPCENDGICSNVRGNPENYPLGFKCDCLTGYYGQRCEDNINECPVESCSGNGFCLDGVNSYTCLCGPGWAGFDCSQPIDDCLDNLCQNNSTCVDLNESYKCLCPNGVEGDLCEREINECLVEPCQNGAQCVDLFTDYRCNCLPGWTGKNCTLDLDECSSNPCLNNATCVNQQDLFSCICPPFYTGLLCEMTFDPCDIDANPCHNNASCVTQTNGTAFCLCQEGYVGIHCEINLNECASSPCFNAALCEDNIAGFVCHCLPGYLGTLCEENFDDCFENVCQNNGTCIDGVNRYFCECASGWSGPNCTIEVDECVSQPCQNGATCINLSESYRCVCPIGYEGNDCEIDINECLSQPCLNNGSCSDGIGNVACTCLEGFTGIICDINIDDCDPFPCNNGSCNDGVAEFTCSCFPGYAGSTCLEDVNECSSQPCVNAGTCLNLANSYRCDCYHGYRGVNCEFDIDVCNNTALNQSQCLNGGSCVDGPGGSFDCLCPSGYTDQYCQTEIDECQSTPCQNGATCLDEINDVTCLCLEGWTDKFCDADTDECLSQPCNNGGICAQLPPPGGYLCFCPQGYQGARCEVNYDECLSDPCLNGATCVNDINLYRCLCPYGYSGPECGDEIDVCTLQPCRNNATCVFVGPGTYNCSCVDGFVGTDCGVEDPCLSSPCFNGGTCQLIQELFICKCPSGYHGDQCQNIFSTLPTLSNDPTTTSAMTTAGSTSKLSSYLSTSVTMVTEPTTVSTSTDFITSTEKLDTYSTNSLPVGTKMSSPLATKLQSGMPSTIEYSSSGTVPVRSISSGKTDPTVSSILSTSDISFPSSSSVEESVTSQSDLTSHNPTSSAMFTNFETMETESQTLPVSSYSKSHASYAIPSVTMATTASILETTEIITDPDENQTTSTSLSEIPKETKSIHTSEIIDTLITTPSTDVSVSRTFTTEVLNFTDEMVTRKASTSVPQTILQTTAISTPALETEDIRSTKVLGTDASTSSEILSGSPKIIPQTTHMASLYQSEETDIMETLELSSEELSSKTSSVVNTKVTDTARPEVTFQSTDASTVTVGGTQEEKMTTLEISTPSSGLASSSSSSPGTYPTFSTSFSMSTTASVLSTRASTLSTDMSPLSTKPSPSTLPVTQAPTFASTIPISDSSRSSTDIPYFSTVTSNQHGTTVVEPISSLSSDFTPSTPESGSTTSMITTSEMKRSSTDQLTTLTSFNPSIRMVSPTAVSMPVSIDSVEMSTIIPTGNAVTQEEGFTSQTIFTPLSRIESSTKVPIATVITGSASTALAVSISQTEATPVQRTSQSHLTPTPRMESSSNIFTSKSTDAPATTLDYTIFQSSVRPPDSGSTQQESLSTSAPISRMVSSSRKSTPESTESAVTSLGSTVYQSSDTATDIAFTHGKSTSSQNNFTPSSRMESSSTIFTPGSSDKSVGTLGISISQSSITQADASTTQTEGVSPNMLSSPSQRMESPTEIQQITTSTNQKYSTNLASTSLQQTQMLSSPELVSTTRGLVTCRSVPCQNGGICRESLVSEVVTYRCDCPFRFGGNFCEQELTIFFPSFDGEAFLEHAPLGFAGYPSNEVFLTLVSRSNSGLILFSESIPTSSSDDYFYLYLSDWKVTAEISCGFGQILRVQSEVVIDPLVHVEVLVRQTRPSGIDFNCKLQLEVNGQMSSIEAFSFIYPQPLGALYVGGIPQNFAPHTSAPVVSGLVGCVRYFQVNSVEYFVYEDAVNGRNIRSCTVNDHCQYEPCRHNGTCVSLTADPAFTCLCQEGYSGLLCEHLIHFCWPNPCLAGATCVPLEAQESFACLCPYGRFGLTCNETLTISRPLFTGTFFGHASHLQYASVLNWDFVLTLRLKFALANTQDSVKSNWLLYSGQKGEGYRGSDYIALGIEENFLKLQFDLGTGAAILRSPQPLNLSLPYHSVQLGRHKQVGWIQVDNQVNVSANTQGHLIGLNTYRDLFIGGLNAGEDAFLPDNLSFQNGFQGCIYDVEVKASQYDEFSLLGRPPGRVNSAVNVGQCSLSECALSECRNGATCVDLGASYRCICPSGWKGPLCEDRINACSAEHDPQPLCSEGALCVLQVVGYACLCPLGKTGRFCTLDQTISDPLFHGDWSFMSFQATSDIRFETNIKMEFKASSQSGLLFYAAQSLRRDAADFISVALTNGYVEFRFSLDGQSDPAIIKTAIPLPLSSDTWHSLEASRFNQLGVLRVNDEELRIRAPGNLISLDVETDLFLGGFADLSLVNPLAVENEVLGFEGCIRHVSVNGLDLELTVDGAKDGRNIGDCDGTGCGYSVCKNNGTCLVQGFDMQDVMCLCQEPFEGETCADISYCTGHLCMNNGTCMPRLESKTYDCVCSLGWTGPFCNQSVNISTSIRLFPQSSLLFIDKDYNISAPTRTNLSVSFKTQSQNGLILWVGLPVGSGAGDYLALGLEDGHIKVGIHLGHDSSTVIIHTADVNHDSWHTVIILRSFTTVTIFLDNELPVTQDIGGSYSSLNTLGHYHFSGFGINQDVSSFTNRLFDSSFEGCLKNVKIGSDEAFVDFSEAEYGYKIEACV